MLQSFSPVQHNEGKRQQREKENTAVLMRRTEGRFCRVVNRRLSVFKKQRRKGWLVRRGQLSDYSQSADISSLVASIEPRSTLKGRSLYVSTYCDDVHVPFRYALIGLRMMKPFENRDRPKPIC